MKIIHYNLLCIDYIYNSLVIYIYERERISPSFFFTLLSIYTLQTFLIIIIVAVCGYVLWYIMMFNTEISGFTKYF